MPDTTFDYTINLDWPGLTAQLNAAKQFIDQTLAGGPPAGPPTGAVPAVPPGLPGPPATLPTASPALWTTPGGLAYATDMRYLRERLQELASGSWVDEVSRQILRGAPLVGPAAEAATDAVRLGRLAAQPGRPLAADA